MAEKMSEEDLLSMLQRMEEDSAQYVTGSLRTARDRAVKEYFQRPYGNEDEGWSKYVASDVLDTVEWMLPDLLDYFISSEKAVVFEPTKASQAEGAKQATQGCNHVFYDQNNGFLVLYSAFKDALMVRNCAVHWYGETQRKKVRVPFRDLSRIELAIKQMQYPDSEIEDEESKQTPVVVQGPDGQPAQEMRETVSGKICYVRETKKVRVEAFEPENLLVHRSWTSPLLDRCPYVARIMEVSLSDVNEMADRMGFDRVEADDLAGSDMPAGNMNDQRYSRGDRTGDLSSTSTPTQTEGIDSMDESQTLGWLRMEWVLADFDGDGIAERRCIYRLEDKVLYNEECDDVPICTGSPVLVQHRWDGISVADLVSDLQLLHTELMRGVVNNAYAANNPRKLLLTDKNGAPYADIGDVLDGRPGGHIRMTQPGAVQWEQTNYVGNQMEPLLNRLDNMREQRTGMTKQRMGVDPNALRADRTLGETEMLNTAAAQRLKLVGRIFAETIVKPVMKGIFGLLCSGDYDKLFFELRGQYIELDPSEWEDSYNMRANVGLGTGDKGQKMATLRGIFQTQMQLAPTPLGSDQMEPVPGPNGQPLVGPDGKPQMRPVRKGLVTPRQIYNTLEEMADLGDIKNIHDYFTDPGQQAPMPAKPPEPPPVQLLIAQARQKADAEQADLQRKFDAWKLKLEAEAEQRAKLDQNQVQAANDERDAQREAQQAVFNQQIRKMELEVDKYKSDLSAWSSIAVEHMRNPAGPLPVGFSVDPATGALMGPDDFRAMKRHLEAMMEVQTAPAEIIRHPETGQIAGAMKNGVFVAVQRDENGRPVGTQPVHDVQAQEPQIQE